MYFSQVRLWVWHSWWDCWGIFFFFLVLQSSFCYCVSQFPNPLPLVLVSSLFPLPTWWKCVRQPPPPPCFFGGGLSCFFFLFPFWLSPINSPVILDHRGWSNTGPTLYPFWTTQDLHNPPLSIPTHNVVSFSTLRDFFFPFRQKTLFFFSLVPVFPFCFFSAAAYPLHWGQVVPLPPSPFWFPPQFI